jgi:Domain of unknown function (DUF4124)
MKKRPPITAVVFALLVGLTLVSTTALADSGRGGRGGGGMGHRGGTPGSHHQGFHHGGRGSHHQGFHHGGPGSHHQGFHHGGPGSHHQGFHHGSKAHHSFNHHGFRHHHGGRSFFSWGAATVYIPPLYYGYGGLPYYAGPPVYSGPPPYYGPNYSAPWPDGPPVSGSVSVAPAPPTPNTIQYPNGRWELSGDGMTPYTWVWIPNPPPPPPAAPPVPPAEPSGEEPTSGSRLPPPPTRIYRWVDEQGVVHLTNRADAVPTMHQTPARSTPHP